MTTWPRAVDVAHVDGADDVDLAGPARMRTWATLTTARSEGQRGRLGAEAA